MIPARISVVTLGARDLAGLKSFYAGLGWRLAIEAGDFAAFETSGAVLTLYTLDALARDAGVEAAEAAEPAGFRGSNLAINVDRPEQVRETIEAARAAGARVTKEADQADWGGWSGYFTDPEDNFWEVAWVPSDSSMAAMIRRAGGGG